MKAGKELKKFKSQIMYGMRKFAFEHQYPDFDEKKYFKSYIDFIDNSENEEVYLKQSRFRMNLNPNPDREKKIGHTYGRDAYLIARELEEGRKVGIGKLGGLEIDGNILMEPYKYPVKKVAEGFEEDDDKSLPNIEDENYKD